MQSFVAKHAEQINGVLNCFDRVIVRGHLPMAGPGYFATWLYSKQIALNWQSPPEAWWNYKEAVPWFSEELKAHAKEVAAAANRPYKHLPSRERMEDNARALAEKNGITDGLVVPQDVGKLFGRFPWFRPVLTSFTAGSDRFSTVRTAG